MRPLLLSFFFLLSLLSLFAQDPDFNAFKIPVRNDTAKKIGKDDDNTYRKVLNQEFSNLATGQSKVSVGPYAAIDVVDAVLSFNASHIFKNGSVLNAKASGAVAD